MGWAALQRIVDRLIGHGMSPVMAEGLVRWTAFFLVLVASILALLFVRLTAVRLFERIARDTRNKWDDKIIESGVLRWISHIVPLVLLQWLGRPALGHPAWLESCLQAYFLIVLLAVLTSLLNAVLRILESSRFKTLPLNGFIQAIKLALYFVCGIFLLSILLDRSPLILLSGLTALSAVMMLIFKDSILGFVAGIQIAVNQMVRIGDWIEMPSQGADGDVIDVSLTTVKVQNWDKTISTIPTYALISESFKNWRGMSESGGRRIKRAIHIDMQTIRFADESMLDDWRKIRLLRPYLNERLEEIAEENTKSGEDMGVLGNGRRLTNIGTFRAYCVAYLRANPHISKTLTFLIRQLQPSEHGLPLEIYVFTNDTRWVAYEDIQSDIFDHLLAILPQFGLSVFQTPSGHDVRDVLCALQKN